MRLGVITIGLWLNIILMVSLAILSLWIADTHIRLLFWLGGAIGFVGLMAIAPPIALLLLFIIHRRDIQ